MVADLEVKRCGSREGVALLEAAALVWEQKLEGNCVVGAGAGQGKKG